MWGVPVVAEAHRNLLQPETGCALVQGNWPWVMGPSAVAGTGYQEGVSSDLCLLSCLGPHVFLGGQGLQSWPILRPLNICSLK